jgi:hypothetical protein
MRYEARLDGVKLQLVWLTVPACAESKAAKAAKKVAEDKHPTVHTLQHQGILQDAKKMKHLVHEFKSAHGSEKKKLKARVMELQQEMTADTKAVDTFGHRAQVTLAPCAMSCVAACALCGTISTSTAPYRKAHCARKWQTAFARAEAKEHGGKESGKKAAVKSRADMSDAERLKADGWD